MNAGAFGWNLLSDTPSSESADLIENPNILMILVDQLRLPQFWLTSSQQSTVDGMCPNIAWLRQTSYNFVNFYVAAQACTPSRATLLTGLYAPQTGMFATQSGSAPALNSGFPTFGTALQDIAGYNASSVMWFGKWHLSNQGAGYDGGSGTDTLPSYGFNYGRSGQIQWPSNNGSPNGTANQGNNGYLYDPPSSPVGTVKVGACDDSIVNDFVYNWANNPPTTGEPWFACVSFVNPHDIHYYPGFFPSIETADPSAQGVPGDPNGEPADGNYQPHASSYATTLLSTAPSGFNYEDTTTLGLKSWNVTATAQDGDNFLQPYFQQDITDECANPPVSPPPSRPTPLGESSYIAFFNWYYYLLSLVDSNIGTVLSTALPGYDSGTFTNPSSTTAIIFLSDHGDYGGSHGLHAKAGAVYDETLRVPLYVVTPSQSGAVKMYQMCSMVDIFKLVVELALGMTYDWASDTKYCDQAGNANQSIFSFIQDPTGTPETRMIYDSEYDTYYPFILTTTDETFLDPEPWTGPPETVNPDCALRNHVMCTRTKSDYDTATFEDAYSGGKLAIYSKWVLYPPEGYYNYLAPLVDGTPSFVQDYEYYDYANYGNRTEISYTPSGGSPTGSDYPAALASQNRGTSTTNGAAANHLLTLMADYFGNAQIMTASGPPPTITSASGIIADYLTRELTGVSGSTALSTYTYAGIHDWYTWLQDLMSAGTMCSS